MNQMHVHGIIKPVAERTKISQNVMAIDTLAVSLLSIHDKFRSRYI